MLGSETYARSSATTGLIMDTRMAAAQEGLFPCASKEQLAKAFIGKRLGDVPTPAAVLDRAVVERNCRQMLEACQALDVDFRPHVKTHKVRALLSC